MKILALGFDNWGKKIKNALSEHDVHVNNNENYNDYDIIIPIVEEYIKKCINKKLHHKSLICENENTIEICENKKLFQEFMEINFPNYIPKNVEPISFPFILKKTIDSNGKNSYVINNEEEYEKYNSQEHFCQQAIIDNKEYATHIIYNNSIKFIRTVMYDCNDELFIKGNKYEVKSSEIINLDNKYILIFDEILKKLNFRGPCCFDYKIVDEQLYIFEINARFGGSAIYKFPRDIINVYINELTNKNH